MEPITTEHIVTKKITKELTIKGNQTLVMKASIITNMVTEDENLSLSLPFFKHKRRQGGFTPEEMKLTDVLRENVAKWAVENREFGKPSSPSIKSSDPAKK